MKANAFVTVGSNIEPAENVPEALARIMEIAEVVAVSTFYRVHALDRPLQPDYRNGVFKIWTDLHPVALHNDMLKEIEAGIGRVRGEDPHAARPIDLDLVMFGDAPFRSEGRFLPDPDILERDFLAVPLAELAPNLRLPGDGRRMRGIATELGYAGLTVDNPLTRMLREMLAHEHESR
jgi:2-amino-4-hydroxy-6-hydroxymethyldihydropteridine diphosphokinase